jgi:hypothetical protein
MSLRPLYHCLAAVLLLAVLSWQLPAEDVAPQLQQAIGDLSSDVFLTREKASEKLLAAGAAAIDPLEKAAAKGELETTARALAVLEQLAVEPTGPAVQDAALAAIKRLAAAGAPVVGPRATQLAEQIAELRKTQAIARLVELGAKLQSQSLLIGPGFLSNAQTIEIGPDFRGELEDLKSLTLIDDLKAVSLTGEQITDAWIERITAVEALQSLKLKKTKVTGAGLEKLKQLKELYVLDCLYFPVDDEAIRPLADMPQLSLVRLFGTKVSNEAAARLSGDLPTTKIDVRRGGFLGIGIEPHPLGCIISRVEGKSMAAKAGLEPGDIILSIAGERPGSFEELTKVISRFEAGQEIELQLYRDGEREKTKIMLGEWE